MVFFWAMLAIIGVVLADFFIPMMPSSAFVTTAVGLVFGDPVLIALVLAGAAGASWLSEFLGYQAFKALRTGRRRRGPRVLKSLIARTAVRVEGAAQQAMVAHPYRATVVARFLPAGRTGLAWLAAGSTGVPYVRMAALGAVLWSVYAVGLGMLAAWIAGPNFEVMIGSIMVAMAVGAILTSIVRRSRFMRAAEAVDEVTST
ncbi:hypothetical protein [Glycomyces harbinensis]|uniref:Membrane protein DedA, SNARE-associated domain n=1 Tax=Glycomyces harbinensis TaxID=58114 RepID=A0A1G7AV72_9ACTN|nr:hypothetical protein [Glycomyces harbinensis]SDE17895.1 membrane protein DedA, SNARE-associated domain [Glycomyces harbinensis]